VCCIEPIPLHVLECFFYVQKILEVLKMCFHMDFLNMKKIVFLYFWILQYVCKTPKSIGQYSKKYKNLILEGIHLLFTANVWIKKSLKTNIQNIIGSNKSAHMLERSLDYNRGHFKFFFHGLWAMRV